MADVYGGFVNRRSSAGDGIIRSKIAATMKTTIYHTKPTPAYSHGRALRTHAIWDPAQVLRQVGSRPGAQAQVLNLNRQFLRNKLPKLEIWADFRKTQGSGS